MKTEKRTQIGQIGRILVLEVTHIWICLRCCQIQDERIYIREVYEIYVQTKTAREKRREKTDKHMPVKLLVDFLAVTVAVVL